MMGPLRDIMLDTIEPWRFDRFFLANPWERAVLTVQIALSIVFGAVLLVPAIKIMGRIRADEASDGEKTTFIVLVMGLFFVAAFLRWWFVPWVRFTF